MWQAKKDQTQALSLAITNLTRPIAKQRLKELSGNDLTLAVEHQVCLGGVFDHVLADRRRA
jgi:hypothetical protein